MTETLLRCACGQVTLAVTGKPILTAACYCDDCQAGGAQIEALPGAWAVRSADGGTHCALYRKDRYRVVSGGDLLEPHKLRERTPTNRVVARCCNSGMLITYDRGPHWVSIYALSYGGDAPRLEMRVNTRFAPAAEPQDVPAYKSFPMSFVWRLVKSRLGMVLGSP